MKNAYLEVTYRRGRPLAAYYYLPRRNGDKSTRTDRVPGEFVVDYTDDGRAIGIEIPFPSLMDVSLFNRLLERLGYQPVADDEFAPLIAA